MKHLLNNISQEEKNSILEQHDGGMTIDTSKFRKLMESNGGNVKPLVSEDFEIESLEDSNGDLKTEIMSTIHNSNASHEEIVSILDDIANEMRSSRKVRDNVHSLWNK